MGYYRRGRCVAPACADRYLSSVLVFFPLVAGVPFYRDPIAADDGGTVGAQSGCGIDCRYGNQNYCRLRGVFCCSARFVVMVLYGGSTRALYLSVAALEALIGVAASRSVAGTNRI